jgi:hypothetical protein
MTPRRCLLAFAALVALAGCANQPFPGQDPTPAAQPKTAPPPPATAGKDSSQGGVTVDNGTATYTTAPSAAATQADMAACYAYASSQKAHDEQIEDDRAAYFNQGTNNASVYAFTSNVANYANEKRQDDLYDECLKSKGYSLTE